MIVQTIEAPLFMSKFLEHTARKNDILNAIASMGTFSFRNKECSLQNTDWHLPRTYNRLYWELIKHELEQHIKQAAEAYSREINKTYIDNYWMQEYGPNDYHDWHFHGQTMFSAVYYLEAPDEIKTTFKFLGREFTVDCEEGDIVTFPSCLQHCSKPNTSGQRKTVIAFNWSVN